MKFIAHIHSTDVGSFPPRVDVTVLDDGARRFNSLLTRNIPSDMFEQEVINAFIDKLNAGIDIPTYPQFRDMNKMFMDIFVQESAIPEVTILKENLSEIRDATELNSVPIRVCITGPYTMCSGVKHNGIFIEAVTDSLCKILENTLFKSKYGETKQVCIDEPTMGFLNDPFLDYGTSGREILRKSWERLCLIAKAKDIETSIHLHNTSDNLFWDVEHLDTIESHVDDSIYSLKSTKNMLEEKDKFLKASVAITLFDRLIMQKVGQDTERLAEAWNNIRLGKTNPNVFLEDVIIMKERLSKIVTQFGIERVPFFGPECGLKGFPNYDCALECLQIVSKSYIQ